MPDCVGKRLSRTVDYRAPRGLDRALFQKLANCEWIEAHDNLILCGPTTRIREPSAPILQKLRVRARSY